LALGAWRLALGGELTLSQILDITVLERFFYAHNFSQKYFLKTIDHKKYAN